MSSRIEIIVKAGTPDRPATQEEINWIADKVRSCSLGAAFPDTKFTVVPEHTPVTIG